MIDGKCEKCAQFTDNHGLKGTVPVCPENVQAYKANPYSTKKPEQFTPVNGDHTIIPDPMPEWLPDDFDQHFTSSSPFTHPAQWWGVHGDL